MSSIRRVWWFIAAATVVLVRWSYPSVTLADVGLGSCSKMGVFSDDRPAVHCADSAHHVYGVWPLVWAGLLVVAPSVVAAVATRWWVSWTAVVAFAALSFYGLAHLMQIQSVLVGAVPLTFISFLVAAAHTAVRFVNGRPDPLRRSHSHHDDSSAHSI